MASIVMVHGAFCGGWTFERLRGPFEAAGYDVLTPDLRGHGAGESAKVVSVSMSDYAADIAALCASLPSPPILLGHSMGGLVAQLAAKRTPVDAVVLLAPSPPWGVAGSSLEEAVTAFGLQMMSPFSSGAVEPDAGLMRRYSLERVPAPEREDIVRRMRPESGRALREALNWWLDPFMTTSVGAGPLSMPALAVVGDRDVVHPPATVRQTAERIGASVQIMPGMSHWLPGEPGWEDVADRVLRWLREAAKAAA
jgi:pimeloyl-ACP methyl ester carboxylesterase